MSTLPKGLICDLGEDDDDDDDPLEQQHKTAQKSRAEQNNTKRIRTESIVG